MINSMTAFARESYRGDEGELVWEIRSVNHRYGKRSRPRITFQMVDTGHLSHADVIRACDCLDYQSCEHDGWERSEAYAILQAIRNRAVDGLSHCSRVWELREPVEAAA